MVRLMLGMPSSGPMRLSAALYSWRLMAARRRAAWIHGARRLADAEAYVRRDAEIHTLSEEIRLAEEAAASVAAALLHRVVGEREKRRSVESEMRRTSTPLALQEQANRMKEALQLEVIERQAAEAKAQRAMRQLASLDSQCRIATETAARLQREQRTSMSHAAGGTRGAVASSSSSAAATVRVPSRSGHQSRSPGTPPPHTPTTAARLATISSVITGASNLGSL
jgi:hypothetical protein